MRSRALATLAATVALSAIPSARARADADEASLEVHPTAGVAKLGEDGTTQKATAPLAGVRGAVTYGVRDWLALGVELGYAQTGSAHFDSVPVMIGGISQAPGPLERSARVADGIVGATVRLGVRVVPTLSVGVGGALRVRPGATYAPAMVVPDDHAASTTIDLVVRAQLGLDYRIDRRWLAGAWAGATAAVPFGAPSYQSVEGGIRVEYAWYPLF
jgi:hypothetical protein